MPDWLKSGDKKREMVLMKNIFANICFSVLHIFYERWPLSSIRNISLYDTHYLTSMKFFKTVDETILCAALQFHNFDELRKFFNSF